MNNILSLSLSHTHLVVYEDKQDVRLVLLRRSCLIALSVSVTLVRFGPMGRQAVQAEEDAQHSQSHGSRRSRRRLHLLLQEPCREQQQQQNLTIQRDLPRTEQQGSGA